MMLVLFPALDILSDPVHSHCKVLCKFWTPVPRSVLFSCRHVFATQCWSVVFAVPTRHFIQSKAVLRAAARKVDCCGIEIISTPERSAGAVLPFEESPQVTTEPSFFKAAQALPVE